MGLYSNGVRALHDKNFDYFELKKDFGELKAGAIFIHDRHDTMYGSLAEGCLKLCFTPQGMCYSGFAANTVFLHYSFSKDKSLFTKIYTRYGDRLKDEIQERINKLQGEINTLNAKLKRL